MRKLLLCYLWLPLAQLGAQTTDTLTLQRAIAIARRQSPQLAMAAARLDLASGRGRTESAWPNPVAEWRRENLDSPLPPDIFATLQVPLDITGRRLALRQAGRAAVQRGRADSSATMRQLEVDVIRSFFRASLAQELASIATREREARERTAAFDAQRFREGAVAEVVAMRTRMEADRSRIALASAQGEAVRARAALAHALGIATAALGELSVVSSESLPALDGLDTSWATVRALRPDLVSARHAAEEAERRWRGERRGMIGDLNLVGGYKGTGGFATGLLGVMVPLPMFSRNEGPRQRALGESGMARAELRDAENRARGEVNAAWLVWEAIRDAGRNGAATLDSRAGEIASIAEASYREGAISLIELIEAQRTRVETRAAAARWMADLQLAELELRRATGAPLFRNP